MLLSCLIWITKRNRDRTTSVESSQIFLNMGWRENMRHQEHDAQTLRKPSLGWLADGQSQTNKCVSISAAIKPGLPSLKCSFGPRVGFSFFRTGLDRGSRGLRLMFNTLLPCLHPRLQFSTRKNKIKMPIMLDCPRIKQKRKQMDTQRISVVNRRLNLNT